MHDLKKLLFLNSPLMASICVNHPNSDSLANYVYRMCALQRLRSVRVLTKHIPILYLKGLVFLFSALSHVGCQPQHEELNPESLFAQIHPDTSGITFRNDLVVNEDLNIVTYLYYYNGGGIAVGDVNADGLPDLFFTANQGPNRLYLNLGDLRFRDVSEAAGIAPTGSWSTGASFADVDADGDLDLYVCEVAGIVGLKGHNKLYINDGTGKFEERAEEFGLAFSGLSTQAAFFDSDQDGDLDLYLLNHSVHDTERQGDASARTRPDLLSGDRLYLQDEHGHFEDVTAISGIFSSRIGYGLGLAVADFDVDGKPDIYVANDFSESDYFFQNKGQATFAESAWISHSSQFSMGNVAADFNSDGRLDVLTLDMRPDRDSIRKSSASSDDVFQHQSRMRQGFGYQISRNALHLNLPSGFVDMAPQIGVHSTDWSWAPATLDADLDGHLDLVIANGIIARPNDLDYIKFSSDKLLQRKASNLDIAALMPTGLAANQAFRGTAIGRMQPVSAEWGLNLIGSTTAIVAVDLDGDGDEDLLSNQVNAPAQIFENTRLASKPSHPTLTLVTTAGGPAVGASIIVSQGSWQRAVALQPVTGFQSSVVGSIVVGLPDVSQPYNLTIIWPQGQRQHLLNLQGNQRLQAPPADHLHIVNEDALCPIPPAQPCVSDQLSHFNEDPLLPLLPTSLHSCAEQETTAKHHHDAPIAQLQLWDDFALLSRGCANDPSSWSVALASTNAGTNGSQLQLKPAPRGEDKSLVTHFASASFVNLPLDGYLIFGGAQRSSSGLTLPARSYAWKVLADGSSTQLTLPNDGRFGMVTDAISVGDSCFIISALWQPVRKLTWHADPHFDAGIRLEVEELTSSGLWLSIIPVPSINTASPTTYVFSNIGRNTLATCDQGVILELNVADFDNNGKADPIFTTLDTNGHRATFFGLDIIARQMPAIRKFFTRYLPFSASSYDDMFPPLEQLGGHRYVAEKFDSVVFDVATGSLRQLPFMLQVGSPTTIDLVPGKSDVLRIQYNSPIMRPELGACFNGWLEVQRDDL